MRTGRSAVLAAGLAASAISAVAARTHGPTHVVLEAWERPVGGTLPAEVDAFLAAIYPPGREERAKNRNVLCEHESDSGHVSPTGRPIRWFPRRCNPADYTLLREAYGGDHRNAVFEIADSSGNRLAWKRFADAGELTAELSALMAAGGLPGVVAPVCTLHRHDGIRVAGDHRARTHRKLRNDDRPGLVVNWAPGEESHVFFSARPKRWALLSAAARKLAAALFSLHDAGIVHGDVKPQNVIVAGDTPETLSLVLVDMGHARRADALDRHHGTPATMAPELVLPADAKNRPLGPGVDVWALGATVGAWAAAAAGVAIADTAGHTRPWTPLRISRKDGARFGGVPALPAPSAGLARRRSRLVAIGTRTLVEAGRAPAHFALPAAVRQLLFHAMPADPRMRRFASAPSRAFLLALPVFAMADE